LRFIDFYENARELIVNDLGLLRPNNYCYEKHYLPHDADAKELGTGASIVELMRVQNINPTVLPRSRVDDGIQTVRAVLPRCWFDKTKCELGIKHLENYRKHYSDKLRTYMDRPLHDEHSHAADAFRYACLPLVRPKTSMSEEDAQRMFDQYNPGV